ncbi:MAG TPA: response regulator [Nitrososphaeraceae archaeon]|nr:response regulator [Nitrososphaeraceae archaeon]
MEDEEKEEISFSNKSSSYCVCFVSMVDSIRFTFQIKDSEKIRKYYSIFINTMAAIARNFGATIIKNTNTSLLYYFPKTSDSTNKFAFRDVVECGITMISASDVINKKIREEEEELPPLYYRISADYGRVETARSMSSPNTEDLFGTTMNICAKINSMAPQNGMVIGGDLYHIIKKSSSSFSDDHHVDCSSFDFKNAGQYSITGFKHQYPVYLVVMRKKSNKYDSNVLNLYKQILNEENPKVKTLPNQIDRKSVNVKTSNEFSNRNDANYDNHIQYYKYDQKKEQQDHPHNIMLIDDEPDMLLTYKTFLSTESYNVEEFTNPQSALQHFAQINSSYYDLVIMDIRMPDLNGLQLYYRLKAINPNVKILFLSALDASEEMVSILPDVKLDDVIRKPVEQQYFLKKVNAAIQ